MNNNLQTLQPRRPDVITSEVELIEFRRKMDASVAVEALFDDKYVLVEDFYSTGLIVLEELNRSLKKRNKKKTFLGQREFRSAFRMASHKLLLQVRDNKLVVPKSPDIGWLKLLYPEKTDFLISFPEIQGLNSSWQWYQKGIEINVLKSRLYPYFGTYFPTRFDHLKLFDKWLKRYSGARNRSIEIGVGCGVLSFQLLQNGFQEVFGTDNNRNAIIGAAEESVRLELNDRLKLSYGDLFADCDFQAELIVFNPPWILAKHQLGEGIDKAIYYDSDLFPRFFEQAQKHLEKDGQLVILFSNFAEVVGTDEVHPVRVELDSGNRFKQELLLHRKVKSPSKKTKRQNFRHNERVELWVLTHK
jgi:methylase of polypeptide subunit release factors